MISGLGSAFSDGVEGKGKRKNKRWKKLYNCSEWVSPSHAWNWKTHSFNAKPLCLFYCYSCMGPNKVYCAVILLFFFWGILFFFFYEASVSNRNQKAELVVNASGGRQIPETFFGIFFEVVYC
ncbi:hypothetical protein Pint_22416 [Pistacia integerrima]|uniref:Uncharacterized protein n=1 Tax=Pistacia integerrima TaxID=434235 RepID=A0ACC0YH59_9ROSI|nr:hypothetical protein Pint_22416 [Pistacia integerrima]